MDKLKDNKFEEDYSKDQLVRRIQIHRIFLNKSEGRGSHKPREDLGQAKDLETITP